MLYIHTTLVLGGGGAERSLSYLKLRPCMTARGPEGASGVGKQFLKSAHWTKESAVFAISVLRMRQSQNHPGLETKAGCEMTHSLIIKYLVVVLNVCQCCV